MEIISIIGVIAGLLGSALTAWAGYKTQKLKNEHELALARFRLDSIKAEADANIRVEGAKIEGEIQLKEIDGFIQSQTQGDTKLFDSKWIDRLMSGTATPWITRLLNGGKVARFLGILIGSIFGFIERVIGMLIACSFAFVDVLKAFIRPGLTLYLTGLSTWITYQAWSVIIANGMELISVEDAFKLFWMMANIILLLTVTAVTWWYADRRMAKDATRIMGKFFNA